MFHLKILLLITIASKACSALQDWEDYLLKGKCDQFHDVVEHLGEWDVKRLQIPELIQNNYVGDLKMAEKIIICMSRLTRGTPFENFYDQVRSYLALQRAMRAYSQRGTDVSVKLASTVSQLNATAKTTLPLGDGRVVEQYVKLFKDEALPSIKSMCFDPWVFIVSPADNKRLGAVAVARGGDGGVLRMWPLGKVSYYDTEDCFKWWVTKREFRINDKQRPVIDIIFTNIEYGRMLVSNEEGDLKATNDLKGDYRFNWWTAEFQTENKEDYGKNIGTFHFYNKNTGKPIRVTEHCHAANEKVIRLGDVTSRVTGPTYFTFS